MAPDWIVVKYGDFTYAAAAIAPQILEVRRTNKRFGTQKICTFFLDNEMGARHWLGDMGLSGRLSRRLLDATIRNQGPLADPAHARRIIASGPEATTAATQRVPARATDQVAAQSGGNGVRGCGEDLQ